jgi:hypothetical protein
MGCNTAAKPIPLFNCYLKGKMMEPKIVTIKVFAGDEQEAKAIVDGSADMISDAGFELFSTNTRKASLSDIKEAEALEIYP